LQARSRHRASREIHLGKITKSNRAAKGPPETVEAVLAEVPAAARMATAKAAHVPAAKPAEMTTAEAAYLAAAEAAHMAEVSAGEVSALAVEAKATVKSVMEMVPSDEERTTKPVAGVVVRIGIAVAIVVAGAILRPIAVIAVRIAGGDAADHSGRDGIVPIAVNVAVSVSPNVVVMAHVHVVPRDRPKARVATRDGPVHAVRDLRVNSIPVMVRNGRRICGRNR
jgi:hypothetical protein